MNLKKINLNQINLSHWLENIPNFFLNIPKNRLYKMFLYASFSFLGLVSARLTNTILLYLFMPNMQNVQASSIKVSSQNKQNIYQDTNPISILGGFFFKDIEVEETEENKETQYEEIVYMPLATLEGHPSIARVVIQIMNSNETPIKEYKIGARLGIDIITWISRSYIWVKRNGQKIKINVDQKSSEIKLPDLKTQKTVTSSSGGVVRKTLSRQEVNKTILGNPAAIYKGASFGPLVEKGNITGYKVYSVQTSHVFYKLGARSGDIIRKVNNFPLSDTERMFELWGAIKTAPQVSIELERNKKKIMYEFQIQN